MGLLFQESPHQLKFGAQPLDYSGAMNGLRAISYQFGLTENPSEELCRLETLYQVLVTVNPQEPLGG